MLKDFREEKGWSQRDLAYKAKVTGAYIAMLETGKKVNPSVAVLKAPRQGARRAGDGAVGMTAQMHRPRL